MGDDSHRELPSRKTLDEAGQLLIKNESGKQFAFSALYEQQSERDRILIVFIRHFFCGACEHYLRALIAALPQDTRVKIIGCGEHILIPDYRERNDIPYPLYADPSLALYKKLGFRQSPRPLVDGYKYRISPYHNKNFFLSALGSIWDGLMLGPKKALSAGPSGQNGGAMLFEGKECKFIHRMRDIGDYYTPEEAKKLLVLNE